jgi:hypothetical protein
LCLRVRVLKVLKDLKGRKMDENVFVREGRKHVKTAGAKWLFFKIFIFKIY